jgi:NADH dehydrogenase FAD-containing subunit
MGREPVDRLEKKPRILIAGLGDTGLLVALDLHPTFEVVGVAPRPALVRGQELGSRLADPDAWRRHYRTDYARYRGLDGMRIVHGLIGGIDLAARRVEVREIDGRVEALDYDVLVIASGVRNGFWRDATLEDLDAVDRRIDGDAARLAQARTIAVVGGGASAVSAASNLKEAHSGTDVHLFFGRDEPLPDHHPRVRRTIAERLLTQGVVLHSGHRAIVPAGFAGERITSEAVEWATGQAPFRADATIWAIGLERPNTAFLPSSILDDAGYVRVDEQLRVPGFEGVFAVGDVAATDPRRSSARNGGAGVVAHNIRRWLSGDEARMKRFSPPAHRWGSILGPQRDGLRVFTPGGSSVRIRPWIVEHVLFPLLVERGMYKGVRPETQRESRRARATSAPIRPNANDD